MLNSPLRSAVCAQVSAYPHWKIFSSLEIVIWSLDRIYSELLMVLLQHLKKNPKITIHNYFHFITITLVMQPFHVIFIVILTDMM